MNQLESELVRDLYSSILLTGSLDGVVTRLSEQHPSVVFTVQSQCTVRNDYYHFDAYNIDDDFVRDFSEVGHLNPFPRILTGAPMNRVAVSTETLSTEQIERTEFFEHICRRRGEINRGNGLILHANGNDVAFLAANLPKRYSEKDETEMIKTLEMVRTHFQAAFKLLLDLNERQRADADTFWLEQIPTAAVVLNETGNALMMNSRAESLFSAGLHILFDRSGTITASSITGRKSLADLVDKVRSSGNPSGPAYVPRQDGKQYAVYGALARPGEPFPIQLGPARYGDRHVLLTILDPDDAPPDTDTALMNAFGLSNRETALVFELVRGNSLKEAAHALGISYNTARNQLASANSKVGSGSQSEIVRMATQFLARTPKT